MNNIEYKSSQETTKRMATAILNKEKVEPQIIEDTLQSIDTNKPTHIQLKDNSILSIEEFHQQLMYIDKNNLLIKVNENGITILYFKNDKEMTELNLDENQSHYRIAFYSKNKENSFDINKEGMCAVRQNEVVNHSQMFLRKYHTKKDYELLKKIIMDSIEVEKLQANILDYLQKNHKDLERIIKEKIDSINRSIISDYHKSKKRRR